MKNLYIITTLVLFNVLIVRGQAFSPADYNPALWLDAADTSTVVHSLGVVSAWNDKSGNANHVTQGDALLKPLYQSTFKGIYFDGSELLMGNNTLGYGADTTITVFVAVNVASGSDKGSVIAKGQWTSGADYRIEFGENGFDATLQGARIWNSETAYWSIAHKNIFSSTFTQDSTVFHHYNTSTIFTKSPVYNVSYNPNSSPFSVGARFIESDFFTGEILEIILFQKQLSDHERREVEGYLMNKWDLTNHISVKHPYKDNDFGVSDAFNFSIAENSPNGSSPGTMTGTYFGSAVAFTDWRIEDGGFYDGMFAINSSTAELTVSDNTHLDFEQISGCYIEVSALGNGATRVYGGASIEITDVADGDPPKVYSELWGQNGEKWDPRGRLPDFSFVGYKSGEETYKYPANIVDVTNFGAVPDDDNSDYAAIMSAINSISKGIVYFPQGKYVIDEIISITSDSIILRGAGNDTVTGTHFYFPKNATELGVTGNVNTGDVGYIINFKGVNAGPQTNIVENTKMGDRTITVDNPSLFDVGDIVTLGYNDSHPVDGELWNHILNDQNPEWPCSVAWSNGNGGLFMYHTIERIVGDMITLKEPIRLDLKPVWTPFVQLRTDWLILNCGVEDIFMEHKYIPQPPHLNEPGYNTIGFDRSAHCWIKNVSTMHADNGFLFKSSGYADIKNLSFYGRGGHHGWKFAYSSHCLANNIDFQNTVLWTHSFTLTHKANGNVVSNISGVSGIPISTDFHRNTPWETLVTNIDNDWNYNSSGVWCAGPNAGKRTVFWNMGGDGFTSYPNWDDYMTTLVGDMHIPEKYHTSKGWHENVPNLSPSNLWEAQLNRRLTMPDDPAFQSDPVIGIRANWWERDPARWRVKNVNGNYEYQLYFGETPTLSGGRLGEYAILDSVFNGNINISVDVRTLENLDINTSADIALIVNYHDDENYNFLRLNSNLAESAIYKVVGGNASLISQVNIQISDNNSNSYSFGRKGDSLRVFYNYQRIASVFENSLSGGKTGIGIYDDAAAFDNIRFNDVLLPTIWTGTASTDWSTKENWDLGNIPVAGTDVSIPTSPVGGNFPETNSLQIADCKNLNIQSNAHLFVPSNTDLTVYATLQNSAGTSGLVLMADATGSASLINNTTGVDASIENFMPKEAWHFLSSPVSIQAIRPEFVPNGSPIPSSNDFYKFDETQYMWINTKDISGNWNNNIEDDFVVGRGYLSDINGTNDITRTFAGKLNNGDKIFNASSTPPITFTDGIGNGWNLMGNPYPSAIDWDDLIRNAIDGSVYIYDGSNEQYLSYNGSTGAITDGIIPPLNGFFIKSSTGAVLTIPNTARKHSSTVFYKEQKYVPELLVLKVEGNGYFDLTYIQFNPEATNTGFDNFHDAYKLFGTDEAPQLYTIASDKNLSINVLPYSNNEITIPLYLKVGNETDYTLSVVENTFWESVDVSIKDLETGNIYDLRHQSSITVNHSPDNTANRFLILINGATDIEENSHEDDGIEIYSYNNHIFINTDNPDEAQVTVVNVLGQTNLGFPRKLSGHTVMGNPQSIDLDLSGQTGFYLITVKTKNGVKTKKVFLR